MHLNTNHISLVAVIWYNDLLDAVEEIGLFENLDVRNHSPFTYPL